MGQFAGNAGVSRKTGGETPQVPPARGRAWLDRVAGDVLDWRIARSAQGPIIVVMLNWPMSEKGLEIQPFSQTTPFPRGTSERSRAVQQQRHGSVVDQFHVHVGRELASRDGHAPGTHFGDELIE